MRLRFHEIFMNISRDKSIKIGQKNLVKMHEHKNENGPKGKDVNQFFIAILTFWEQISMKL